jgi:nicotinamide-nucleotide amidase
MGGVISYDNSVKEQELGVSQNILESFGAVSSECAAALASGAREKFKTTYALSVTGIAGPDGGTPEKPVGLVWFGLATTERALTTCFRLTGDRQIIRTRAISIALDLLRRAILGLPTDHRL